MSFYIRSDMAKITVFLGSPGVKQGDEWATFEGGGLEADDQKTRPGGMKQQVAIGGPSSRGDVTVTTQMTDSMVEVAKSFEKAVGKKEMQVTVAYYDNDGATVNTRQFQVKGFVKSCQIPSMDINSGDVAFLTVVGSLDEATPTT